MAVSAGSREAWSEALGGLHDAVGAAALVGLDVNMLQRAAEAGRVIVLTDSGGRDVYPGFQFKHGWPPDALIPVWRTIAAVADPWTAAAWAAAPDPLLGDLAPVDCASGAGAARAFELAGHDAAWLAQ